MLINKFVIAKAGYSAFQHRLFRAFFNNEYFCHDVSPGFGDERGSQRGNCCVGDAEKMWQRRSSGITNSCYSRGSQRNQDDDDSRMTSFHFQVRHYIH
jgi:hypothetical protein